jgi:hypothetical protein
MLDIIGGTMDIIGAQRGHAAQAQPHMGGKTLPAWLHRTASVQEALPSGAALVNVSSGVPRRLNMGIPPFTFVGPGFAGGVITMQPQLPIRVERITWNSSLATSTARFFPAVGVVPQTVTQEPLPIQAFRETAFDMEFSGNTLNVGQVMSLTVSQVVGAAETIFGVVQGTSLQ